LQQCATVIRSRQITVRARVHIRTTTTRVEPLNSALQRQLRSDFLMNFSLWIPKLLLNLALFEHVLHDMVLLESLDQLQSLLDQLIRAVLMHLMTMTRMKTMKMKTTRTMMRTSKNMKQHSNLVYI